jgi:putative ABC transport system permease protein
VPYVFASYERAQRGDRALTVVARLRDGVSIQRARTDAVDVMRIVAQRDPTTSRGWTPEIVSLRDVVIGNAGYALELLLIATLGLLAVGCANVANTLIARLLDRRHELATRAAIGASVMRLVQQVVTEAVVLGGFGGAGAFLLALAGTRWLAALGPEYLPRGGDVRFDGLVVILAGFVVTAVAAVLALLVTLSLRRLELGTAMRSRIARRNDGSHTLRDAFAVGQLALSVVLLADGLLLTMSMRKLQAVELGFDPRGLSSVAVSLPYPSAERRVAFVNQVLESLSGTSGIRGAAVTSRVPFTASATGGIVNTVESPGERSPAPPAAVTVVSPEFFATLRISRLAGRFFSTQDRADAPRVAVVDETLARQLSIDGGAVGKRVRLGGGTGADTTMIEIIGVAASARLVDPAVTSAPTIYLPYAQTAWPSMSVVARADERSTADVLRTLRAAIQSVDPRRPVYNSRIVQRSLNAALATRRLQTLLLVGFGGAALVIALLGVHALFSHSVRQRHREFGIRLATGAAREDVIRLVLREASVRVVVGITLGLIIAMALGGLLRNALFGVAPWNIGAIAVGAALPAIGAMFASYLPARRAAQVNPMVVLRAD